MSAIQLLEQLGANASLQSQKRELAATISENFEPNAKLWCLMFPEKDEEEQNDDGEEKSQINVH